MSETEFDYEGYNNNVEQAVQLREKFRRFRNMTFFFVLYSVCYALFMCKWITNGLLVFVSLVAVFIATKILAYVVDDVILAISIHRKNREHEKSIKKKRNRKL